MDVFGINVLGYFEYNFGMAELCRLIVACLESANIPYVINNLKTSVHNLSHENIKNLNNDNIYPVNIIVANSREMDAVIQQKTVKYFSNKYNIGVWCWETERFPTVPSNILTYFNEIWTISEFCKEAIKKTINLPISVIKLPVVLPEDILYYPRIDRSKFVVLFMFDYLSILERKNPLGAITAFKLAFSDNPNVLLAIKSINQKHYSNSQVQQAVKDCTNILMFDESLDKSDTLALINSCDVYLSLHRSEGLGLGMREAMAMGKVVIATGYSGNLDFMSEENSLLVKYNKTKISLNAQPYGHYGESWAEPDIEDAVRKLKRVYEDKDFREIIQAYAKKSIEKDWNLKICGEDMTSKLNNILNIINNNNYNPLNMTFDEEYYLNTYADVKNAVLKNLIKNGETHYLSYGQKENRLCKWITNNLVYN